MCGVMVSCVRPLSTVLALWSLGSVRSLPSDSPSDSLGPLWGQTAGLSAIPFPSVLATDCLCQYKLDFELVDTGCEGL